MTLETVARDLSPSLVKQCCASAYDSDIARLLLGDSFHPGGTRLTERLGELLNLTPSMRVLDVAAGKGTSAIALARRFGCDTVGIDFSRRNVEEANRDAKALGLGEKASFLSAGGQ